MSKAQLRNCGNKRRFSSKSEAASVASDKKLGFYVCPVCSGFHLTSQKTAETRTARQPSSEPEKPVFDASLLARAKWKRP